MSAAPESADSAMHLEFDKFLEELQMPLASALALGHMLSELILHKTNAQTEDINDPRGREQQMIACIEAIQGRLDFMDAMVDKACLVTRG